MPDRPAASTPWPASPTAPVAGHTAALAALAFLFAARVAGQAIQRWLPVSFLPPFSAFQGSALPYWILLPAQLAILALMLAVVRRVHRKTVERRPSTGRALALFGGAYLAIMLARLIIGLTVPAAPIWFKGTISAAFHLVLATFVLVLARYHSHDSKAHFR